MTGPLDPDELEELREFMAERRGGYLFDIGTIDYYEEQKRRLRLYGHHDGSLFTHAAVVRLLPESIRGDFTPAAARVRQVGA